MEKESMHAEKDITDARLHTEEDVLDIDLNSSYDVRLSDDRDGRTIVMLRVCLTVETETVRRCFCCATCVPIVTSVRQNVYHAAVFYALPHCLKTR